MVEVGKPVAVALKLTTAPHKPISLLTAIFEGQEITGAAHDCDTLTVCIHVATLPFTSVTVQVTIVLPNGYGPGLSSVVLNTPQLSPVVGLPIEPVEVFWPGSVSKLAVGGQVIVGSSLSVTITVCVHVAEFPLASVAVHVTNVDPTA